VPRNREIITPRILADAEQLDLVFSHRIDTMRASPESADTDDLSIEPSDGE